MWSDDMSLQADHFFNESPDILVKSNLFVPTGTIRVSKEIGHRMANFSECFNTC
jgi:hypothetical protein